jgi:hypothetical protein
MAGRPPLRIGQHGRIVREHRGSGVWLARTRFCDADGVTRRIRRVGPADEFDKYGKLAEDALLTAPAERRPPIRPGPRPGCASGPGSCSDPGSAPLPPTSSIGVERSLQFLRRAGDGGGRDREVARRSLMQKRPQMSAEISRIAARRRRLAPNTSAPSPSPKTTSPPYRSPRPPRRAEPCRWPTSPVAPPGKRPQQSSPVSPAASACAPPPRAPAPTPTSANTAPTSAPTPATCPFWQPNAPTPKPSPKTPPNAAGSAKPTATAN